MYVCMNMCIYTYISCVNIIHKNIQIYVFIFIHIHTHHKHAYLLNIFASSICLSLQKALPCASRSPMQKTLLVGVVITHQCRACLQCSQDHSKKTCGCAQKGREVDQNMNCALFGWMKIHISSIHPNYFGVNSSRLWTSSPHMLWCSTSVGGGMEQWNIGL